MSHPAFPRNLLAAAVVVVGSLGAAAHVSVQPANAAPVKHLSVSVVGLGVDA